MRRFRLFLLLLPILLGAPGCLRATGYCLDAGDCPTGTSCDPNTDRCAPSTATTCFTPKSPLTAPGVPVAMALGGFATPGKPDLLVLTSSGSDAILASQGNGTYAAPKFLPTAAPALSVVAGDWNGDGRLDAAIGRNSGLAGIIQIYLGQSGGLNPTAMIALPGPRSLAAKDLNGDGNPDLVAASYDGNDLTTLLNDGMGNFTKSVTPSLQQPQVVLALDLNGDQTVDLLAIAGTMPPLVQALLGRGDGSYNVPATVSTGSDPTAVAAADVNGDGVPDLAVADGSGGYVSLLLGTGNGSFGAPIRLGPGTTPGPVLFGDVNSDHFQDLIVAESGAAAVQLYLGRGDGTFAAAQIFTVVPRPIALILGDVDGDGKPDLLAASGMEPSISLLINTCP